MAHHRAQLTFKDQPQIKTSLSVLKFHPGARHLLGKPITDHKIDLSDENSIIRKANKATYKIPVKGPEGHGFYHLQVFVADDKTWRVVKSQLEIRETSKLEKEEYEGKMLMVFNEEKNGDLIEYYTDNVKNSIS
eukprot:TRINITY_DN5595_c0_g1_i8.p1 TRINITY_DN5595_c0_g1~~TRINITY_DN5595_c0_g1_i8.p1  ORF type:complete len:134 (+),score=17.10 TRINITY_DN5595_c0_g1_i8:79-480(+)